MNVYVFVSGKVFAFSESRDFDLEPIGEGKALVEVKGESRGQIVIGPGDSVMLGSRVPILWKTPEIASNGLYVGAPGRWFVLQPITRYERSADVLKVFANIQAGLSVEHLVGLFWLKVGDIYGRSFSV